MKCLTFLFILIPSIANAGLKEFCASTWPDNFQMQEHCMDQQDAALKRFYRIAEEQNFGHNGRISTAGNSSNPYERIAQHCLDTWREPSFDTYNFQMVEHCYQQQVKAYDRVNR